MNIEKPMTPLDFLSNDHEITNMLIGLLTAVQTPDWRSLQLQIAVAEILVKYLKQMADLRETFEEMYIEQTLDSMVAGEL
jgi:hypothetical protein